MPRPFGRSQPQRFGRTASLTVVCCLFAAPSGALHTWMRVTGHLLHNQLQMLLFWKVHTPGPRQIRSVFPARSCPYWRRFFVLHLVTFQPSARFRANGRNLSYVVSALRNFNKRGKLCATTGSHCTFHVPRKARKVYLVALNAAGRSSPTSVPIYHPIGTAANARLRKTARL